MDDQVYGSVVAVEIRPAATELVGTHTAPLSVLQVLDVSDFPASGSLKVGGDTLAYTSTAALAPDSGLTDNPTITLSAPTATTYASGALCATVPAREHKMALVSIPGLPEPVEALVRHSLHDKMAEGPRQPGTGETVLLEPRGQEFVVADVMGRPAVDASYLLPGTAMSSVVNLSDLGWAALVAGLIPAAVPDRNDTVFFSANGDIIARGTA